MLEERKAWGDEPEWASGDTWASRSSMNYGWKVFPAPVVETNQGLVRAPGEAATIQPAFNYPQFSLAIQDRLDLARGEVEREVHGAVARASHRSISIFS